MRGPSRRKWGTWLPEIWTRLRHSKTSLPQSSLTSVPATLPEVTEVKDWDWENEELRASGDQVQDHVRNLKVAKVHGTS